MLRHGQDEPRSAPGAAHGVHVPAGAAGPRDTVLATDVADAGRAHGVPGSEPPFEAQGAERVARELSAAGFASIYETAHHGFGAMGVGRTVRALRTLNQKHGYDCPSCAWPDPDGERNAFEFCENGAKAVASEATLKRATPAFFAQHTLSALRQRSDLWLEQQGRLTEPMLLEPGSE